MKNPLLTAATLLTALTAALGVATGCRQSTPPATSPAATEPLAAPSAAKPSPAITPAASGPAREWTPTVHGIPYQLSLKGGAFGFCDDSGSQTLDFATGRQVSGMATCDRGHEVTQSSCDDRVKIYGDTDPGNDDLSVGDHDYTLRGHSRECDLDGHLLVISTANAVQLIDFAANRVATIDPAGGDKAVLGSGWVAWTSLNLKRPLRLETTTQALTTGKTPKP